MNEVSADELIAQIVNPKYAKTTQEKLNNCRMMLEVWTKYNKITDEETKDRLSIEVEYLNISAYNGVEVRKQIISLIQQLDEVSN